MEIVERPWGTYEVLLDEPLYKVKRIVVKAGHRLSYQSHQRRDEHWTIVGPGTAEITLDDETFVGDPNSYFWIPALTKHRIKALDFDVVFIEVQTGSYFGEDDIIRYEDDYNRVSQT